MRYHFFVAEGCEKVADQDLEIGEQIEVFRMRDFETAREVLLSDGIDTSTATISALKFAENCFKSEEKS